MPGRTRIPSFRSFPPFPPFPPFLPFPPFPPFPPFLWWAAVLLGATAGVGLYTFGYAEGLSYFSADPKACVSCHIMNDEYRSWTRSSHHAVARCVDCHLPHTLIAKLLAKAENGWHHSKGFTLEDFHEPILIKPNNARILQESCLVCHGAFVHDLVAGATTDERAVHCMHCHGHVGHGPRS